jgi:predicted nuclease with TOPRIM domain
MKDVNSLKGIHGLGTMQSKKKRSIPRVQSSTYLDLYMLDKEKERLLKEDAKLSMRRDDVRKRLEDIEFEMNKMQGAEVAAKAQTDVVALGRTLAHTNGIQKEFKTMALSY